MLSVIVCTYNRERYLAALLESVAANTLSPELFAIYVIDNRSEDDTRGVTERFAAAHPAHTVHYVYEAQQGLSFARNCGIAASTGDVLLFLDDDATVSDTMLAAYVEFFASHPEAGAAGGPIFPVYETAEPHWMSHYTRRLITGCLYFGRREKPFTHGSYPGMGNAAVRRSVFERIGLYKTELGRKGESLMGAEEKDLFERMREAGLSVTYLPVPILYHQIGARKLTPDYFNRLTYAIGQTERLRTRGISKAKYLKRLFSEGVKWCASLVLFVGYTLMLSPDKGWKLLLFRRNVTRGLLGK